MFRQSGIILEQIVWLNLYGFLGSLVLAFLFLPYLIARGRQARGSEQLVFMCLLSALLWFLWPVALCRGVFGVSNSKTNRSEDYSDDEQDGDEEDGQGYCDPPSEHRAVVLGAPPTSNGDDPEQRSQQANAHKNLVLLGKRDHKVGAGKGCSENPGVSKTGCCAHPASVPDKTEAVKTNELRT